LRWNQSEQGNKLPHNAPLPFGHEWAVLQDNHEQYEKTSLLIKLGGIALFVACMVLSVDIFTGLLLILVLWIQEAVLRTSQSRLGERILRIEQLISQAAPAPAYQLHTEWQATRPGIGGLLAEYGKNMLRPTVAFPYVVLMGMTLAWVMFA
jgi:hypothetical protein